MTGYIRFFLAFLVLLSHAGIRFYGLNPGVVAVVIFYLLAGSVVSHLLAEIIPSGKGQMPRFYLDRILRIFPLYLYVVALTALFLFFTSFGAPQVSFIKIINNLFIIPLNYFMYIDSTILTNPSWCLVPPSWSLGAELQAYLLLPLVIKNYNLKILTTLASFIVYMLANLSIFHPDYFGYRLIFGVFFIFVIGSSMQRNNSTTLHTSDTFDRWLPLTAWVLIFMSACIFFYTDSFSPAYSKETFLGLLLGIPLIYLTFQTKKKLPLNSLLGSLSYGVFLCHFLVIWFLESLNIAQKGNAVYIILLLLLSIFISYLGVVVVESQITKVRIKRPRKKVAVIS
jgi:peptidoglycan/LPS O-acetylase OafA/YrhL